MGDAPTILCIDDSKDLTQALRILLKDQGYRVEIALNAAEAFQRLAQGPVNLILLDIMMPGMDGFELGRKLKIDPATRHIPLLYLTARSDLNDEFEGYCIGAEDYITKPFSTRDLLDKIRSRLASPGGLTEGEISRRGMHYRGRRAMLIEPDMDRARLIARELAHRGLDVTIVENVEAAQELFEFEHFHLVIANGGSVAGEGAAYEIAGSRQVREKKVPVISVVAEPTRRVLETMTQRGIYHYVTVPVQISKLIEQIDRALALY